MIIIFLVRFVGFLNDHIYHRKTESSEKMYVREILHEDSYRFCKAKFGPGPCIKTVDRYTGS